MELEKQLAIRAFEFVERLAEIDTPQAVWDAFLREAHAAGYDAMALHLIPPIASKPLEDFLLTTWPGIWRETYDAGELSRDDAIIEVTPQFTGLVTWDMIRAKRRKEGRNVRVLDVAQSLGWLNGFAVPVFGPNGYCAIFGACGVEADPPPRSIAAMQIMALHVHERIKELLAPELTRRESIAVTLTPREIECVKWLLAGKSDWEIGEILGIAEATVHWRIERAKKKLGIKTRAQLTALAVHYGLVRP